MTTQACAECARSAGAAAHGNLGACILAAWQFLVKMQAMQWPPKSAILFGMGFSQQLCAAVDGSGYSGSDLAFKKPPPPGWRGATPRPMAATG